MTKGATLTQPKAYNFNLTSRHYNIVMERVIKHATRGRIISRSEALREILEDIDRIEKATLEHQPSR